MNTNVLTVASMIVILTIGVGIGWGFQTTVSPSSSGALTTTGSTATQTVNQSGAQGPYSLTLVITTNNRFNSTVGDQPAYFVLTPNGLESSAKITLPANTLVKLTILNYDDGNASLTNPGYANVQGTVNGTITYVNNGNVNSSQTPTGISVAGGQTVTSVPIADIAHTFTIPSLGINIPIPESSIVTAYIKIRTAGTYTWYCETACGSGASGLAGAMDTPGWMTGDVVASAEAAVSASQSGVAANQNGPYQLTLVEAMMVRWNSTVMQPKFYVLGPQGLESSASISLPAHRLIHVTIFSYDTPTPGVSAEWGNVTGTVGGSMYFYNGTLATGIANETAAQMMMPLGKNVTSVPAGAIAHTFTIQQLGVNLPVVGGSTEMAYLYFNDTGTFNWQCMTPCGFGTNSAGGAMDTPGWMTGTVVVS